MQTKQLLRKIIRKASGIVIGLTFSRAMPAWDTEGSSSPLKCIQTGKCPTSYIPYFHGQTQLLVYNFFSINYGVRSDIDLTIIAFGENYKILGFNRLKLPLRGIKLINPDTELQCCAEKAVSSNVKYIALMATNNNLRSYHANLEFRYWGVYNKFAAYCHSWKLHLQAASIYNLTRHIPLPDAVRKYLWRTLESKRKVHAERQCIPDQAKHSLHLSQGEKPCSFDGNGDLSGLKKVVPGFTVLSKTESFDCIHSVFHNGVFNREERHSPCDQDWITHSVAVPPISNIRIELFFGECCSNNSKFRLEIYEESRSNKIMSKTILIDNTNDSIILNNIVQDYCFGERFCWIDLTPLAGLHSKNYVNAFYSAHGSSPFGDNVHSHSLISPKSFESEHPRTLKFCPLLISSDCSNSHDGNEDIEAESYLAVWGHESKNVTFRLRVFSESDSSFEHIRSIELKASEIACIDMSRELNSCLKRKPLIQSSGIFVAQIESENANLNASMFVSTTSEGSTRIGVDHLTGG